MTLIELLKNRKHRERLREILHVFFEEELGSLIAQTNLLQYLPMQKRIKAYFDKRKHSDLPRKIRLSFEKLGPTFIKLGQLLSLRPDLIPPEYVEEFEKMQDHVPPFTYREAKKIIEKELKKPLEKIFTDFPKKSFASASVSQVYKAKIGKQVVAVKVQRPNIQEKIENDIEIMYKIIEILEEHIPEIRDYHFKGVVHEFEKWTLKELNFEIEAYYAQKIAENFKGSKILKVPKIYKDYTTSKVLTMEFLDGIPLHNIEELKKKKVNIRRIIRNGYYIALKQVFIDGFFHADPHPGNILVLKDGKIGLIDFGILGHFDKKLKRYALDLFHTFINNDPDKAVNTILRMNPVSDVNRERFRDDVRDIFEHLHSTKLEELQIGPLIKETLATANKHHIKIPADFVLYAKTISIVEGIALLYQPNFNFYKETQNVFKELLDYNYFVNEFIEKTTDKVKEYGDLIQTFPETAEELFEKAKRFKLAIDVEDADVRSLTTELERSSGNLSLGFIIAALIIASALLMQLDRFYTYSIFGLIFAGILGLWLIHRTVFVKLKRRY